MRSISIDEKNIEIGTRNDEVDTLMSGVWKAFYKVRST
jgi:hypothetical protein